MLPRDGAGTTGTVGAAGNYASLLIRLKRFEEAKSILSKAIPVARRVLGESHDLTLKMRSIYAQALYLDANATLDDHREAVTTLEEIERTARRVFGSAHPTTEKIELDLRDARAALRARESWCPSSGALFYAKEIAIIAIIAWLLRYFVFNE